MAPNAGRGPARRLARRGRGGRTALSVAAVAAVVVVAAGMAGCGATGAASGPPVGALDSVRGGPGSVSVRGWALDPDTPAPITVDVSIDGEGHALTADLARPEVGIAFPDLGPDHGFEATFAVAGGSHSVCAYAIDAGDGSSGLVGCLDVVVPVGVPLGAIDVASGADGSVSLAGWAFDPETTGPIDVLVISAGVRRTVEAGESRPDVDVAFPGAGGSHGYRVSFAAAVGAQDVCVWALDTGPGTDVLLGCRTVEVIPPYAGNRDGPTVAVVGNSVTALSVEEIPVALDDAYWSSSAGRSGRTIEELLPLADQYATTDPSIVVIEAGSNDAGVPDAEWSGLQALAAEGRMLAKFPNAECVVWVNVTTHTTRGGFNAHAREVDAGLTYWQTRDARLAVADWDSATAGRSDLLIDGVHPNHEGQRALADLIRDAVDHCGARVTEKSP